jgi:hypothetical protein
VLAWLAVGAFSHVVWDAFTHQDGWVVERVPALSASLLPGVRVYKVLQHASTVVGLSLLAYWSWGWDRRQAPVPGVGDSMLSSATRATVVTGLVGLALVSGTLVACRDFDEAMAHGAYGVVVRFVIASIAAFLAGSLAYAVVYQALQAGRSSRRR